MADQKLEAPELDHMSTHDLCWLMLACGLSEDPSDKAFVKACRDELAKRKPETSCAALATTTQGEQKS